MAVAGRLVHSKLPVTAEGCVYATAGASVPVRRDKASECQDSNNCM